jgi:mRNA interferase MazF
MTDYEPGDVVLVPYPFGERAGGKQRPALVVSSDEHNRETGELLIAQITSRVSAAPRIGDYLIQGWREANLPRPALVRARLATIESRQVLRRLGRLPEPELRLAQADLQSVFCRPDPGQPHLGPVIGLPSFGGDPAGP